MNCRELNNFTDHNTEDERSPRSDEGAIECEESVFQCSSGRRFELQREAFNGHFSGQ